MDAVLAALTRVPDGQEWQIFERNDSWIFVRPRLTPVPTQGWKLHLAAYDTSAMELLEGAIPVIAAMRSAFKVVASLARIKELNQGFAGLSQVGKVVTIYPANDDVAVRLAQLLWRALPNFEGPAIPTDHRLAGRSVVHYRYGAFHRRFVRTRLGEIIAAIVDPDGLLVPDVRSVPPANPVWVADPFAAAGIPLEPMDSDALVDGRYWELAVLRSSLRNQVKLSLDLVGLRTCVLKMALQTADAGLPGTAHERRVLERAAIVGAGPAVLGTVTCDGRTTLVLEDIAGEPLHERLSAMRAEGRFFTWPEFFRLSTALTGLVGVLHANGIVHGDIKASNIILTPGGWCRIVDFESARLLADSNTGQLLLTPGYAAPELTAGSVPTVATDIYSLGALLFTVATLASPPPSPRSAAELDRLLHHLRPDTDSRLRAVIVRCMALEATDRYHDVCAVHEALETTSLDAHASRRLPAPLPKPLGERDVLAAAVETTLAVASAALRAMRAEGEPPLGQDVYSGAGGIVMLLADAAAHGDCDCAAALGEMCEQLLLNARIPPPLPGLYVGDAGTAVALFRAGQMLGDEALIANAHEFAQVSLQADCPSPDLLNGLAGRIRMLLLLHVACGMGEYLQRAVEAGVRLLAMADDHAPSTAPTWQTPEGYGSLSGGRWLGYAHGAAGVADVLLDLWTATGFPPFRSAAFSVADWLCNTQPVLVDCSGAAWPKELSDPTAAPAFWCHGAAGIGLFLLHCVEQGHKGALPAVRAAAKSVVDTTRWTGNSQCHGLAGSIEFLLDAARIPEGGALHADAASLGTILVARVDDEVRALSAAVRSARSGLSYMTGLAGAAHALLRLAEPAVARILELPARRLGPCQRVPLRSSPRSDRDSRIGE